MGPFPSLRGKAGSSVQSIPSRKAPSFPACHQSFPVCHQPCVRTPQACGSSTSCPSLLAERGCFWSVSIWMRCLNMCTGLSLAACRPACPGSSIAVSREGVCAGSGSLETGGCGVLGQEVKRTGPQAGPWGYGAQGLSSAARITGIQCAPVGRPTARPCLFSATHVRTVSRSETHTRTVNFSSLRHRPGTKRL